MKSVLILDGNQRSALAVTRSLGRKGVSVTVGDAHLNTLAGASKYCQAQWAYPVPSGDSRAFCDAVAAKCAQDQIGVLLPMTDRTLELMLQHRDRFQHTAIPFGDIQAFRTLTDKVRLHDCANSLGIRMPRTNHVSSVSDTECVAIGWRFPIVVKPAVPHTRHQTWAVPKVRYVWSRAELREAVQQYLDAHDGSVLVQEFVEGEARGVFQLCEHGRPVAMFSHRRIREKPPSGGVSVLSESIPVAPDLRRMTEQLLAEVGWHGLAMTEWKIPVSGPPCLLEVNARFWGSLQLAVDSNMDFPLYVYQMADGCTPEAPVTYRTGIRSRWLLGDVDRLYMGLCKADELRRMTWRSRLRMLLEFCRPNGPNLYYDVNRWDDIGPFWYEARRYVAALAS